MSFYSIFPKLKTLKSERKPKEPAFELVDEQALNKSYTSSGTSTEQAVVPSINYINNTNIANKKNVANRERNKKIKEINNDLKMKLKMKCPLHSPTPIKIKLKQQTKEKKVARKKEIRFGFTNSNRKKISMEELKSFLSLRA
jgi:pyocin large subunit-like protein